MIEEVAPSFEDTVQLLRYVTTLFAGLAQIQNALKIYDKQANMLNLNEVSRL